MKLDKYIHVFNDAITSDFCDQIIEEYDDPEDWKPGTINDYEVNDYSCLLYTSPSPRDS